MEIICCKKFDGLGIDGPATIPNGSKITTFGNVLSWNEKRVCLLTSQNFYDHFAMNDDGKGKKRFSLTHGILADVAEMKAQYQTKVAEVMAMQIPNEKKRKLLDAIRDVPSEFFGKVHADPVFRTYMKNGVFSFMFYYGAIDQLERLDALLAEVRKDA